MLPQGRSAPGRDLHTPAQHRLRGSPCKANTYTQIQTSVLLEKQGKAGQLILDRPDCTNLEYHCTRTRIVEIPALKGPPRCLLCPNPTGLRALLQPGNKGALAVQE